MAQGNLVIEVLEHQKKHKILCQNLAESEETLSRLLDTLDRQNRSLASMLENLFKKTNQRPKVLRYPDFVTGTVNYADMVRHLNKHNSITIETNNESIIDDLKRAGLKAEKSKGEAHSFAIFRIDFSDDAQSNALYHMLDRNQISR